MLTKGRPSNYYPDTRHYKVSDEEKFRMLSVTHDPITQLRFLYNVNKNNHIFESKFRRLIEMDALTYMKKLDQLLRSRKYIPASKL